MAGRPGCVENRPRIVVRGRHRPDIARIGRGLGRLEVVAKTQLDRYVETVDRLGEIVLVDQHAGAAVVDDELQLRRRQPPVEGNENRREFRAREQRFEDVGGVAGQKRDPVARLDTLVGQPVGEPAAPVIEFAVGERQIAPVVDQSDPVGAEVGMVTDPVIRRNVTHLASSRAAHPAPTVP